MESAYFYEATYRNDPGDNHDDGEDKTDDENISFAVERTLLVLKINLELGVISVIARLSLDDGVEQVV